MIAEQGRVPNGYADTKIYLDANAKNEMTGYLAHPAEKCVWRFEGMVDLIDLFEGIFSKANYPQQTSQLRDLRGSAAYKERNAMKELQQDPDRITLKDKPTFIVRVQYRQNSSWQGTIKWVEGDKDMRFRSTLELLRLMDSVVGDSAAAAWREQGE